MFLFVKLFDCFGIFVPQTTGLPSVLPYIMSWIPGPTCYSTVKTVFLDGTELCKLSRPRTHLLRPEIRVRLRRSIPKAQPGYRYRWWSALIVFPIHLHLVLWRNLRRILIHDSNIKTNPKSTSASTPLHSAAGLRRFFWGYETAYETTWAGSLSFPLLPSESKSVMLQSNTRSRTKSHRKP